MKNLLLALCIVLPLVAHAAPGRSLVSSPVFLYIPLPNGMGGTGSGFMLLASNKQFLVSAKHVFFGETGTNLIGPVLKMVIWPMGATNPTIMTYRLDMALARNAFRYSQNRDVALACIGTGSNVIQMDPLLVTESNGQLGQVATPEILVRWDDVVVARDVYTFGYPGFLAKPTLEQQRPRARKGIVSDKDPDDRRILLDLPVHRGNSGGPVFDWDETTRRFSVIGIVVTNLNADNQSSGYSAAEPTDGIFEVLSQAPWP